MIGGTFALEGEARKAVRETLAAGGGEWFVENRLTVADLKCYLRVRWLKSGVLDHVPSDIVDRHAARGR